MDELINTGNTIRVSRTLVLERLPAGGYPPDDEGDLTNLAYYYRLRGITAWLSRADLASYATDLFHSMQVRFYYLQGCAAGQTGTPKFFRTSRNRACFDAIAVNDLATARQLAELCDDIFVEELEYEDDFLFPQLLQVFLLMLGGQRTAQDFQNTLDRLERVLDGDASPFFDVGQALQARDGKALERSLEAAMQLRANNYSDAAENSWLPPIFTTTEHYVDIQGIAIVRLATEAGMTLSRHEFTRIPEELVEVAHRNNPPPAPDAWRQL